jgi:cytochrome P450
VLFRSFAQHLPIRIFMRMLGLPEADRLRLLPLAAKQVSASADKAAAMAELAGYIAQRVAERRAAPGDDLISRIATAEVEGGPIRIEDAIGVCLLLLIGGLDTVATMMGQIMRFLAQSPDHRRALLADAKLLPNAIEEFLRRFSLTNPARAVAHDMEFHGVAMRAGDMVMLSTPTAAVDLATYDDPLRVDFTRKSPTKATFGAGPHVCPGSMLARAEIKVMLQEWLARIPEFTLDPNDPPQITTGVNITVDRLPLVW